ncbi:MAG: cryptochrome/photolyase family protein [Bacteroidia bacterium]|nr:cryptochrome/photolyase family protein [Bacteroidia bacterium]
MAFHTLRLVLGDQLNPRHSWYQRVDPQVLYVLMEVRTEATYVRQHLKKLAVFFAAMRRFAAALTAQGHPVRYYRITDPDNGQSFEANLRTVLEAEGIRRFEYQAPDEYRLDRALAEFAGSLAIETACVDTEHFLTQRHDLARLMGSKKQWLLETFYRHERTRLGILLEPDGTPVGGRWNYDADNRNPPPPRSAALPPPPDFGNDYREVLSDIAAAGLPHFGRADGQDYPLDRPQALQALRDFVAHGLPHFGTYQDSMRTDAPWLYHSLLSFALNVKLLHPREVVAAALAAWQAAPERIGLAQLEGFVRQIIGWREYIRGMYWAHMPRYATTNHLGADRPLPGWYWTGDTKMSCLRRAIADSLHNAYAHHIQRLMVTGNFAALIGADPEEVNAWYLGIYADAIEWVQLPNTHGMSQYADGGKLATKPYVASGAYIDRMSDYCAGCHYRVKQKTGAGACPLNSLYWHFLHRNAATLGGNFRLAQPYSTWRRMGPDQQAAYLATAEAYLAELETL